jgi:nicotinamidase-related amidase
VSAAEPAVPGPSQDEIAAAFDELGRELRERGFGKRVGFGERPAVVAVDMIRAFTDPAAPMGTSDFDEAVLAARAVLDAARAAGLPVFLVTSSYDQARREAGNWELKVDHDGMLHGSEWIEFDERLGRAASDQVVVKKYPSCLFGTDLNSRLVSQRVDTLIIVGVSTSGCVRATAVDACSSGYRTIVVEEAVGDRFLLTHRANLFDVDMKYGDVVRLEETVSYLSSLGRPRGVHLVGSIPLSNNEDVFRTVARVLGDRIERIPDGETGKRLVWNSWTRPSYERTPGLEVVPPAPDSYTPWNRVRLTIAPEDLVLDRLGFADAAIDSYGVFARLKAEGSVPERVRFQVCLPSPIAPMVILVEEGSRAGVEPAHVRQLLGEVGEILAAIPHDQLAIQWDVCQDLGIWEGVFEPWFADPKQGVVDRLAALARAIPEPVEMGFHLCYGDFKHKHFVEPADAATIVEMSNAFSEAVERPVNWIHAPVPRDRDDEAYFRPFRELRLRPETKYYLGLIHHTDGIEGATRRIAAARTAIEDFGVATECGFGRRDGRTVPSLMRLHADIAAPAVYA